MFYVTGCRLCLACNVRLYDILNTNLQEIYEKLTNTQLLGADGRPHTACYICFTILKKCYLLKERSVRANKVLTDLWMHGSVINQKSFENIDRQSLNLTHSLCSSPPECIDIHQEVITDNIIVTVKKEVPLELDNLSNVKEETKKPVKEETIKESDTDDNHILDCDQPLVNQSDSDDDIPLDSIKRTLEMKQNNHVKFKRFKLNSKIGKKSKRGSLFDFAHEIILNKEQQIEALQQRLKSDNYLNSPYKCELCYKGFLHIVAYNNHKEKHEEKSGPHKCDICHIRYITQRQLRTHVATAHSRQYACNACGLLSHTANQAREHEKWHKGYIYECQLCSHKFIKSTSYLTHMRMRHPTGHVCKVCGRCFLGRHGLLMHISKAHKRDEILEDGPQTLASRFCADCDIQFVTVTAWKRHMLTSVKHSYDIENSAQCLICGAAYGSTDARMHLKQHARALNSLPAHRAAPSVNNGLPCDQCGSKFSDRSRLQVHVKRIHLGRKYNKNIVCEVCGKKCTSNAALRYHQRTHTGERPYSCSGCSKSFADKNQLRIHTRTHTGERPYACNDCGKRFSQKPALNRHYRVHTGAKPYVCTYCSKNFSQSNSLKLHIRSVHLKMPDKRKTKTQVFIKSDATDEKKEENLALQSL